MPRIRHIGGHGSILTAKGGGAAGDAPDFVGATTAQATSTNPLNLSLPAGWAANDIFIGIILVPNSGGNVLNMLPAGWAGLGQHYFNASSGLGATIFCKLAKAGDTAIGVAGGAGTNTRTAILAAYRPKGIVDFQLDQLPIPIFNIPSVPGAVTIPSSIAKRKSRLIISSACDVNFGDATVPTPPAGMVQRANHLYSGFHRQYLFDGVVNKGEDISRVVQWSSPSASNKVGATVALLL